MVECMKVGYKTREKTTFHSLHSVVLTSFLGDMCIGRSRPCCLLAVEICMFWRVDDGMRCFIYIIVVGIIVVTESGC